MRTAVVVSVLTVSAFIGSSAWAAFHSPADHQLDQYQEDYNYSCTIGTPWGPTKMAQTFVPSLDGTVCHIQIGNMTGISWSPQSRPVVEIFQGQPGSAWEFLGSATPEYFMPYQDGVGDWIAPEMSGSPGPDGWTPLIDFSVSVTKGQMYSIVLSSLDPSGTVSVSAVADPLTDPYGDGALWAYDQNGEWKSYTVGDIPVFDMQFRTYIVPVPLPAGVWLGIFAVGVAGWHLKRHTA